MTEKVAVPHRDELRQRNEERSQRDAEQGPAKKNQDAAPILSGFEERPAGSTGLSSAELLLITLAPVTRIVSTHVDVKRSISLMNCGNAASRCSST